MKATRRTKQRQGRNKNEATTTRSHIRGPRTTTKRRRRASRANRIEPQVIAEPIQASRTSIHSGWIKQLGGLIRLLNHSSDDDALRHVEQIYIQNGCSVEATRDALLRSMGATKDPDNNWIDLRMVMEENDTRTHLPTIQRPGEGPAHAANMWNTTLVPQECVGKSYFVSVVNRSNIHLSCEMTIDGTKVAWNAPIPAGTSRTIKPEPRYYGKHLWVLRHAKRIPLHRRVRHQQKQTHTTPRQPRYNGIRPNYNGMRISWTDFPDPCTYGWTFTGSVQDSRVEFYEKAFNLGVVKLDFYYTTGTVKTVLHHPTTGTNQLFRNCQTTPVIFRQILINPRVHTSIGYRRRSDSPQDEVDVQMTDDDGGDEYSTVSSATGATDAHSPHPVFFAKNSDYDFAKEGHANRQAAMAELQPTNEFQAWEDAARMEWACIHAKFYVSNVQPRRASFRKGSDVKIKPKRLPSAKPIVNVKATETASFSTEFHALGPAQATRSSHVRMKRISLNEDSDWKSGPIFETKLYYRAEHLPEEETSTMEDQEMNSDDDDMPLAEKLVQQVPLESYKEEKLQQLEGWHKENKALDAEEADEMRISARQQMQAAPDIGTVDQALKHYWDWHQKKQWVAAGEASL